MKDKQPIQENLYKKFQNETQGIERDLVLELKRSRTRAWIGFSASLGIAIIGMGIGFMGFTQEAPDPLVLRVDNTSGAVDVVSKLEEKVTYDRIVDEYFLNKYVINRESYDYYTIQMTYDTTALLSSTNEQRAFFSVYQGENSVDKILKDRARINVSIRSIEPNGKGQATVRFMTEMKIKNKPSITKNFVAHIGYRYLDAVMSVKDRRVNPLGFQVTSYETFPEVIGE